MRIVRHPRFDKSLQRLPKAVRRALADRLELLLADSRHPLLNDHALAGEFRGLRSVNVTGDWRLIYGRVDAATLLLVRIGTHHDLYGS